MFDFSFAELLLIVVVCVVFISPKDVPVIIKTVAKALRAAKNLTQEIKDAFDELSRESGIEEVKETLGAEMRMIRGDDGKFYESYDMGAVLPKTVKKDDSAG